LTYLKFLGTSDSQGVPRLLCTCAVCTTRAPQNIRTRPSVAIQTPDEQILIDISPDFHQQFAHHNTGTIPQTVLITHLHNDHISGIGDFADVCFWHKSPARIVSPPENITGLKQRYPYLSPVRNITFIPTIELDLALWHVSFHYVNHGVNGYAYAIRFQGPDFVWMYMPDAFQATPEQLAPFHNLDLLIMGASEWHETSDPRHRAIYDVQEALQLKQQCAIKRVVFTHLSHNIDIPRHQQQLPSDAEFAFDGMELALHA
jgi:phosphoribosyl 1,2-cyclic phosphate phosphodiesterase